MNCKYNNKNCNNGSIFDGNGDFRGRCKCKIVEWLDYGYRWSETPLKYRKKAPIKHFNSETIYLEGHEIDSKQEIIELVKSYDELKGKGMNEPARFILQGTPGAGKTQFAVTLAFEIYKSIDWNKPELESEIQHFFYLSVSRILKEGVLFDKEKKENIWNKIREAKVLILDDLGEELDYIEKDKQGNWVKVDKRVNELLDFLKAIFDEYSGITIVTTNIARPKLEEHYERIQKRFCSRLFTDGTLLQYSFKFKERDLRDEQKNDAVDRIKNRFKQ